jgi:cyclophilin family peptidyl-prolyl cis-trans isomerase/protein-disulfide isomerase
MKTFPLVILLVMGFILAACAPATTMPSFVEPTAVVEATIAPTSSTDPSTAGEAVVPVDDGPAVCKPGFSVLSTPDPTQAALAAAIPPVTDKDWTRGNPNAKYTLVEYSDFMCPYCAALSPVLQQLMAEHPDDVRLVFRHFPLPSHPLSILGTQAAEAAGLQGKFWEVTDYLLQNQAEWTSLDEPAFEAFLLDKAEAWGLDKGQFSKDLRSDAMVKAARDAQNAANTAGITYTPFVMLNDRVLQGGEIQNLDAVIKILDSEATNYADCPPTILDATKTYIAKVETAKGSFSFKLFADKAPLAVNSFVFLAREGWYDNLPFNDIVKDTAENGYQIAIAGDHTDTGYGSAGYSIGLENSGQKYDRKGLVGMVNGSQIFFTFAPQPSLDGRFSIIGEVVDGMDVLESLPVTVTADGQTLPPETILKISISEE